MLYIINHSIDGVMVCLDAKKCEKASGNCVQFVRENENLAVMGCGGGKSKEPLSVPVGVKYIR